MANLFSATAVLLCAALAWLSVQLVRVGLGEATSVGRGLWVLSVVIVVFLGAGLFYVLWRYGQGGALREKGSAEAPLTGALADNAHWVLGLFYVDHDDPSLLVESRFGIGYSLNYGNRSAVLILVAFLALMLGLAVIGLVGFAL